MPSPAISGESYDSLGSDMGDFGVSTSGTKVPNFGRMFMGRELVSSIALMRLLGVEVDQNSRIMRALQITMVTNAAMFGFYRALRAIRQADTMRQTAMAAAETAASLPPPTAWKIPIAAAAGVAVAASFAVGFEIGAGNISLPAVNVSNPQDRRTAERSIRGVRG